MRTAQLGAAALLSAIAFFFWVAPANAALRLCNQTSYVIYAATGIENNSGIVTQGWTRVAPGACELPISGELTAPAYYLYARTSQAHAGPSHAWGGNAQFCVKDANFTLRTQMGAPDCPSDDAFAMPFAAIDTHAMKSWTMTLTESAKLNTMDAARDAGIDRLLGDIGYRIGLGNAQSAANRDAALKKFRERMKLPASATSADLFDALETEALKAAAPAGYSICNDSNDAVWAAIGLKQGKDFVSRGWWMIAPGACAKAITDALSADKIYLHAERHADNHLVSGAANFCVTNIVFEVQGNKNCAGRGLSNAGFAATNTKGLIGFAAHISQDGLVPPAPVLR